MHTARRPGEYDRARSTLRVVLLVGCTCMGWDRQVEASSGSVRARSQGERIVKSACEESEWAFLLTVKRIGARQKRSCELAKLS